MSRHRTSQDQMGYDSDRDELIGMIRALQNRCTALESAQTKKTTTATPTTNVVNTVSIASPTSTQFGPQLPNLVLAGPATGATADAPTFRGLVALDIPALDTSKITTGTMATARLGSGSAAATTLLHGNSAWSAIVTADLPATGVTPGTYVTGTRLLPLGNDGTITIDATGRVTAITAAT